LSSSLQPNAPVPTRRTDLDALRGFAMALGIVLHASLSFFPSAWPVQDSEQSGYFYLFYAVIHSFRMPLFFVLSGFFTAFLLRRSGLGETVRQRALRILLPMLLALLTIVPLNNYLSEIAIERTGVPEGEADPLVPAIVRNDVETVRRELSRLGAGWTDGAHGFSALYWAALAGHPEMIDLCLRAGSDIAGRNPSGSTPLHAAALFGHDRAVAFLLERGADPAARDSQGVTPFQRSILWATFAPSAARRLGLPAIDDVVLADGRAHSNELLLAAGPRPPDAAPLLYNHSLLSNTFRFSVGGTEFQVFASKFFDHLWFLWLLWWLFLFFAVAWKFGLAPSGRRLWIFPLLSLIPQWFMMSPVGPDLWMGPVPPPHVVFYYGCFFWFGAAVFARDGMQTKMGKRWKILLPLGLFVLLPACLGLLGNKSVATVLQAATAWVLLLGVIGIFHRYGSSLGPKARWVSDAAYWMYLVHLPLVMAVQLAVAFLPWPAAVKFLLVNAVVIAALLVSYQLFVRYTWLGTLLNGPRSPARLTGGASHG
jgi:peptidoglycan/LPS O-acetylase OafA/YrhL